MFRQVQFFSGRAVLKLQFILFPMANDEARSVVGVRLFDVLLGKQHLPCLSISEQERDDHSHSTEVEKESIASNTFVRTQTIQ